MTNGDALKWLEKLKQDIGKPQHSELWHYEQALSEIEELLKEQKNSRLTTMTPNHTKVEYANGEAWITDECPRCYAKGLGIWERLLDRYVPFCRRCGQAISWSEYDNDEKKIDFEKYLKESDRLNRFIELKKEMAKDETH